MPGSKRVNPQHWSIRLAPWLLALIALAFIFTLVVLASSLLGFTPE